MFHLCLFLLGWQLSSESLRNGDHRIPTDAIGKSVILEEKGNQGLRLCPKSKTLAFLDAKTLN